MEKEEEGIKALLQQAQQSIKQIKKDEVRELTAYKTLPPAVLFVIKVFYAMITDQDLDKNKEFTRIVNPSQPKVFQQRKLTWKFQQLFESFNGCNIIETTNAFNSQEMSEETYQYLKRLQIQYLEGSSPLITQEKIQNCSYMGTKLWKWCKNMLQIRRRLVKTYD